MKTLNGRAALWKWALAFILLGTVALGGCGQKGPPDIVPVYEGVASLNPQDWYFFYGVGVPQHPVLDPEGDWSFEIPNSANGGCVAYLQTPFWATVTPHTVTLTFKIESDSPQYVVIDPSDHPPATFHLFFEQQNDNLIDGNGRWWADAPSDIYNFGSADGQVITYSVPLTPELWGNVYGKFDAQAFYAALSNIGWLGVTFGGQFFAGHGIALSSGTAKLILVNLTVS